MGKIISDIFRMFSEQITAHPRSVYVALGVLCVAVYGRTLDVPFYFDDFTFVVNNPFIQSVSGIFDTELIARTEADEVLKHNLPVRPLSYLSFALNYAIHQGDVRGYHVVNTVIHLLNACLVYMSVLLAFRCHSERTSGTAVSGHPLGIAFFTAALYTVHPVMTGTVTYIVQRMALLSTFFYLLAVVQYAASRVTLEKKSRIIKYLSSLLFCAAAVKSKEIALTLPFMLALYDGIFCSGTVRERFQRVTPFLLCAVAAFVIGGSGGPIPPDISEKPSIQQVVEFAKMSPGKYLTTQFFTNPNMTSVVSMSPLEYLFTQFRVVVTYQRLLLFPVGLNFVHDYPFYRSLLRPEVLASLLLHLALLGGAVMLLRLSRSVPVEKKFPCRLAAFGVFWFYLCLVMESSVVPLDDLLLECRMYLPAFGFLVACVSLLHVTVRPVQFKWTAVVLIVLCVALTLRRNEQWRDTIVLRHYAPAKSPGKLRIHGYIGNVYMDRGEIHKALYEYKRAFSGEYRYAQDHISLGRMFAENGLYQDAVDEFLAALKLKPDSVEVYAELAEAYHRLGNDTQSAWAKQKAVESGVRIR